MSKGRGPVCLLGWGGTGPLGASGAGCGALRFEIGGRVSEIDTLDLATQSPGCSDPLNRDALIRCLRIFDRSVFGLIARRSAAPSVPSTRPREAASAASIAVRTTSSSGRIESVCGGDAGAGSWGAITRAAPMAAEIASR